MMSKKAMTEIVNAPRQVLDHGRVQLVEKWGSDEKIVEAARMSTGGGFVSWEPYAGHSRGDMGLLAHLYAERHTSPFEMAGLIVEVEAPIMVLRQWHRHRTQSYSEASARYSPLPQTDYVPSVSRLLHGAGDNRQAQAAQGAHELTHDHANEWIAQLRAHQAAAEQLYQAGLAEGVPKELARLALTPARYTTMRASANLHNWLHFLLLRADAHAQWEIQQYAWAILDLLVELFPRTMHLFATERGVSAELKGQRRALWRAMAFEFGRAAFPGGNDDARR